MLLFRLAPVFVVMTLIWTCSTRAGATGWLAVGVATFVHIMFSNGRAFVESMQRNSTVSVNYGSYHIVASLIAAAGGVAASFLGPYSKSLVPKNEALLEAFWTASLVAIVAALFLRFTIPDNRDPRSASYLFWRAWRDMGIDIYDYMFKAASNANCDPLMVIAVGTVEVLQRPKWVRRCENAFGHIVGKGSYGVMQMSSDRPLTDEKSIESFTVEHRNSYNFKRLGSETRMKPNAVWKVGGVHNGDKIFIESISSIYQWLLETVIWIDSEKATGQIGILEKRKYPRHWGIRIATTSDIVEVAGAYQGEGAVYERPSDCPQGHWWYFEHKCDIERDSILIGEPGKLSMVTLSVDDDKSHFERSEGVDRG